MDVLVRQRANPSLTNLLLQTLDHGTQTGGPVRAQQILHFGRLGMQQQCTRQAIAGHDEFLACLHPLPDLARLVTQPLRSACIDKADGSPRPDRSRLALTPHDFSRTSSISSEHDKLNRMKTARKPTESSRRIAPPAMSVNIDPLVEVVQRHVKLTPQATRLIKSEFAQLFQNPTISGSTRKPTTIKSEPATDPVLTTQEAADLVGVSRPYIVARIEAGDIPLHQQVGNQRRVLQSAVLAWHRQEQTRRRKALGQLGADLDSEIFAG